MTKIRSFVFKGRKLEIRAVPSGEGWWIQVFEDGKFARNVIYVRFEDVSDAEAQKSPYDLVDEIFKAVQSYIEEGKIKLTPKS